MEKEGKKTQIHTKLIEARITEAPSIAVSHWCTSIKA